jgi:endogenous inhibitor of DNA gyrase (YacG/DUF329 family)
MDNAELENGILQQFSVSSTTTKGWNSFDCPFNGDMYRACSRCRKIEPSNHSRHYGHFCYCKQCNNYVGEWMSGSYQQLYGKYKMQRMELDTEYYPSDEEVAYSQDRILMKLQEVEETVEHFAGNQMISAIQNKILEGTIHEDWFNTCISTIRNDYRYKPSREQFNNLCELWEADARSDDTTIVLISDHSDNDDSTVSNLTYN